MEKNQKKELTRDEKFLKKLLKDSLERAETLSKNLSENQGGSDALLDHNLISAYEIGFHINFQPLLVKRFVKIVGKYLQKHQDSVVKVQQLVTILSKVALSITSLRTLERIFNSKELMDALAKHVVWRHW
tara:strand:+ start:62 stop:451 length:390 start_codon:yes stop_codon:yes gene_type:complete